MKSKEVTSSPFLGMSTRTQPYRANRLAEVRLGFLLLKKQKVSK